MMPKWMMVTFQFQCCTEENYNYLRLKLSSYTNNYAFMVHSHRFMCRLDSSVNYILNDILTSSLRFTSRIHKPLEEAFVYTHLIEITACFFYTLFCTFIYCTYCVPNNVTYGPQESHILAVCALLSLE